MASKSARVVDTNVAITANGGHPDASDHCLKACQEALMAIISKQVYLAVDDGFEIMREYLQHLSLSGQPGVGDQFLKWVHDHQFDPEQCERVTLTTHSSRGYNEFPDDGELSSFDLSDRKFAATARASRAQARVLNAVDSDWWDYEMVLARHGIEVDHVCEDQVVRWEQSRPR